MRMTSGAVRKIGVMALSAFLAAVLSTPAAAQQPVEITKTDITRQKSIDASQITVLGVRLGEAKDQALKTLQQIASVKVQEDQASGRIFVLAPPTGNSAVMSLKVVENQVTTINLVGGFGEWLQGDTRLLFRAFEDDSLRHKLLGREDAREVVRGGTKEAPAVDITYAYFKEGILLHSSMKQTADSKQVEARREMVLLFPARSR
ncbi:MAG: hypothetical protein WC713_02125 [Candidatus Methylomirabilota bacterium]